jgi:predicted transglutaminase-like cysteine proteinase
MLRITWLILVAVASVSSQTTVLAASQRLVATPKQMARIPFAAPTVAPLAHTQFCLRYPDECRSQPSKNPDLSFKSMPRAELELINQQINNAIRPRPHMDTPLGSEWALRPEFGDCKDYAATKRHELISRGWPSSSALLAEVVISSGEHHLVLVARIGEGDFVLDNLDPEVRSWLEMPYTWVRIQSPENPRFWKTISTLPRDPNQMPGGYASLGID